jgi:diacylglycerol kinase (ATP)
VAREIALLTNPSAGKGKGSRSAAIALPRLREAGFHVRQLAGRDGDEALDLAKSAVTDGVESLVVCGGDGWSWRPVLASTDNLEHHRPPGTAWPATSGSAQRPAGRGRRGGRLHVRTIDLAMRVSYFVTVLAAGFDSKVNSGRTRWCGRAGRCATRWPTGQCGSSSRCRTLELDGEVHRLDAMLVAVGNGSSFGGGLKITTAPRSTAGSSTWS